MYEGVLLSGGGYEIPRNKSLMVPVADLRKRALSAGYGWGPSVA